MYKLNTWLNSRKQQIDEREYEEIPKHYLRWYEELRPAVVGCDYGIDARGEESQ